MKSDLFLKKYKFTKEILGSGEFGKVLKAVRLGDNNKKTYVAIKALPKKKLDNSQVDLIKQEIRILNTLDHPNIIKYYEEYENDKYIYLVMEYCEGGDLYD